MLSDFKNKKIIDNGIIDKVPVKLFHLSATNNDGAIFEPRVPDNYYTQNGMEDNKLKRICFGETIANCIKGMFDKKPGEDYFVHVPTRKPRKVEYAKDKNVPDASLTKEIWVKEKVQLKCIGKIKIIAQTPLPETNIDKKNVKTQTRPNICEYTYQWIESYI